MAKTVSASLMVSVLTHKLYNADENYNKILKMPIFTKLSFKGENEEKVIGAFKKLIGDVSSDCDMLYAVNVAVVFESSDVIVEYYSPIIFKDISKDVYNLFFNTKGKFKREVCVGRFDVFGHERLSTDDSYENNYIGTLVFYTE